MTEEGNAKINENYVVLSLFQVSNVSAVSKMA
jgi:hypothetical protein